MCMDVNYMYMYVFCWCCIMFAWYTSGRYGMVHMRQYRIRYVIWYNDKYHKIYLLQSSSNLMFVSNDKQVKYLEVVETIGIPYCNTCHMMVRSWFLGVRPRSGRPGPAKTLCRYSDVFFACSKYLSGAGLVAVMRKPARGEIAADFKGGDPSRKSKTSRVNSPLFILLDGRIMVLTGEDHHFVEK